MPRQAAWLVLVIGLVVWTVALTQGWLGGDLGGGRSGGGDRAGRPFDPRDVPVTVDVYEYGFTPSNVVIKAGHAVAWKDVGKEHHTIEPTSAAGWRVFVRARREGSAAHVFPRPGVYPYHCSIHPWMRGTVTVRRQV